MIASTALRRLLWYLVGQVFDHANGTPAFLYFFLIGCTIFARSGSNYPKSDVLIASIVSLLQTREAPRIKAWPSFNVQHPIHGSAMLNFLGKLPFRRSRQSSSASSEPEPESRLKQLYPPRPLPSKRKRTLTLPLPPSAVSRFGRPKQHTSPQANCAFLQKLPYDIRRIIYDEILSGNIFHIIRMRGRLRHLRCSTEDGEPRDLRSTCWGILKVDERSIREFYNDRRTDGGIVPLLRTCRVM